MGAPTVTSYVAPTLPANPILRRLTSIGTGSLSTGGGLPLPPAGYGYVFKTDGQGNNQIVYFTDASSVSRPYLARLAA